MVWENVSLEVRWSGWLPEIWTLLWMDKFPLAGTGMEMMRLCMGARVVRFAVVVMPFTRVVRVVLTSGWVPRFCTMMWAWVAFFVLEMVMEFSEASRAFGLRMVATLGTPPPVWESGPRVPMSLREERMREAVWVRGLGVEVPMLARPAMRPVMMGVELEVPLTFTALLPG